MQTYVGLDNDENGGMTLIGRIIRDAWVFGLLPEGDTFAGRNAAEVQNLSDQVHRAWEPYGQLPSRMPPELAQRFDLVSFDPRGVGASAAIAQARAQGWSAELGDDD